jgi:hypothetical protein
MLRPVIHAGLAALLVIAPALCCCNVRLLGAQLASRPAKQPYSTCPQPEPVVPSCCHAPASTTPRSCCEAEASSSPNSGQLPNHSKEPLRERCEMCSAKTDAIPPETDPVVGGREPAGEKIPIALLGLTALPVEHLALVGGLDPPERAGEDVRTDSLFLRHVLRC